MLVNCSFSVRIPFVTAYCDQSRYGVGSSKSSLKIHLKACGLKYFHVADACGYGVFLASFLNARSRNYRENDALVSALPSECHLEPYTLFCGSIAHDQHGRFSF